MKNKPSKVLIVISLIVLGLGISSLLTTCLSKTFSVEELKLLAITISVGLISLIWLIYGIVNLFKNSKFGYKNLLIIGASLLSLILLVLLWMSVIKFNNIKFKKIEYDYNITYVDRFGTYNIYKKGDEVEVYSEEQVICVVDPCPSIKIINKIEFSDKNMKIVNDFIDSFFTNQEYNEVQLRREDLNEEQANILESIIRNDESLLANIANKDVELVFSLKSQKLKCPSPTLYVYSDGTYEYYYTYSSNNKKTIPKTGTYDYDINLILGNIAEYEVDTASLYALTDNDNKLHVLADYKPLDDFLESIGINMHTCLEHQK